jgi:hypothetical protein
VEILQAASEAVLDEAVEMARGYMRHLEDWKNLSWTIVSSALASEAPYP